MSTSDRIHFSLKADESMRREVTLEAGAVTRQASQNPRDIGREATRAQCRIDRRYFAAARAAKACRFPGFIGALIGAGISFLLGL